MAWYIHYPVLRAALLREEGKLCVLVQTKDIGLLQFTAIVQN